MNRSLFFTEILALALAPLLLVALCSNSAKADELYGRIRGVTSDASGAILPSVRLKATDVGTGISAEVVSDNQGNFVFLQLKPGIYQLTASKSGFKSFSANNITVIHDEIYVQNVRLEVGGLSETVEVQANPVQVETNSTELESTISGQNVVDMPLNGRNWIQLQQTLPGVVSTSNRFSNNYATNGSQAQQNSFLVNGVDTNDLPNNTPLVIPSPDAISEVTLVTNTINPEYGRNSGAILNAEVKSGTNAFHGSAFDFYRDSFLNSTAWFSQTPAVFHQNQFGGTIGGPVWKNHTFFFFSYQGTRARQAETAANAGQSTIGDVTVFSSAERGGDFSGGASGCPFAGSSPLPFVDSNGVTQPAGTSYCTLWPNGVINPVNFNSISTNLMNTFVPLPNSGSDFFFNPITTVKTDQEIFKIDHTFNSHDSLWGYGLLQRNPTQDTLPFVGATLPGFAEIARAHTQQYVVAWNHAFNGNMLNEVRLGYTRLNLVSVQPVKPVLPSSVGFNGIIPQFPAGAGIPVIAVTGLFTLGFSDDGPQPRKDDTYQLTDNFTKVVGRHAFKVGFEGRRFHVDNPFFFSNGGHFDFAGSGPFSTGVPGADYLLGIPDDYQQSSGGVTDAKAQEYYSYFQDQFKLRSNLTLNYGVGWQIDTPLTDRFNKGVAINCFLPGHQSTVFPTAPQGLTFPGDTGCSSAGYSTKWGHFGPRFGVAYSPGTSGKTSIRAGAGLYFNRSEEELTLQNLLAPPFSLFDVGINDDTQLPMATTPSFANPYTDVTGNFSIPNKYPFTPPQPGNTNINFGPFEPLSINVIDPKFTTPRALNYNLTFERELPGRMIFSAAYVGAEARRLIGVREQNPGINPAGCAADPNCVNGRVFQNVFFPQNFKYNGSVFGGVGQQGTFNTSNYNALQTTVRKAFSRGIEFLASYTWSHSLDTGSSFENSAFGGSPRAQDFYNQHVDYADSEFDVRHRFVASYVYSFPQLKDFSKGLQYLIGGWRVAGITTLQTGFPIFTSDGGFRSLTCTAFTKYSCPDHGNYLGGFHATNPRTATFVNQIKGGTTANNQYYFDPNIFSLEAFGTLGSARRDNFHGPGLNNTDLALYKDLPIRESMKFELRLEGFNVFNHAQFKNPSGNINSHNFGRVTALQIAPRIVQIAGKFYF